MKVLITGSSGHLGEALIRTHRQLGNTTVGVDLTASPFTDVVASIADPGVAERLMDGVEGVFHTATLHKPHVATHSKAAFVETNISGTLELLEAAARQQVGFFVFTSTTSVFGDAMRPEPGEPAAWITEAVTPRAKNIYGATKLAAENLCLLFHRNHGLNTLVLRTSRFFPEEDDSQAARQAFSSANLKATEFLYRRVEISDVVSAHLAAAAQAHNIGHGLFIISATSPFKPTDLTQLHSNPATVVARIYPEYQAIYEHQGFKMLNSIDRVYVNSKARSQLGWEPHYDFSTILTELRNGQFRGSELAQTIGTKGYHAQTFDDGPYPVE